MCWEAKMQAFLYVLHPPEEDTHTPSPLYVKSRVGNALAAKSWIGCADGAEVAGI